MTARRGADALYAQARFLIDRAVRLFRLRLSPEFLPNPEMKGALAEGGELGRKLPRSCEEMRARIMEEAGRVAAALEQ